MAEPIIGFEGTSAFKGSPSGPVVAGAHEQRYGVFAARMYSTHRHTLIETVGRVEKGTVVTTSVQNLSTEKKPIPKGSQVGLRISDMQGEGLEHKDNCIEEHGDPRKLENSRESHVIFAVAALPAEEQEIEAIHVRKRGTNKTPDTVVSVAKAHKLNFGDIIQLVDVMGHPTIGGGETSTAAMDRQSQLMAADLALKLGDKAKAQRLLDGVRFDNEEKSELIALLINGHHMVEPLSDCTFLVPQELDGSFVKSKGENKAKVILRPARPILLSDEE